MTSQRPFCVWFSLTFGPMGPCAPRSPLSPFCPDWIPGTWIVRTCTHKENKQFKVENPSQNIRVQNIASVYPVMHGGSSRTRTSVEDGILIKAPISEFISVVVWKKGESQARSTLRLKCVQMTIIMLLANGVFFVGKLINEKFFTRTVPGSPFSPLSPLRPGDPAQPGLPWAPVSPSWPLIRTQIKKHGYTKLNTRVFDCLRQRMSW